MFGSCGQPMGMGGFPAPEPDYADRQRQDRIKEHKKVADRLAPAKVIVGTIVDAREDYANCRVCVTVETYEDDVEGFTGSHKHEGYIEALDVAGVAELAHRIYAERTAALDARTGKILEVSREIF